MRRLAASVALIVSSTLVVAVPSTAHAATTGLSVSHGTVAVETVSGKRVVYVPARCLGSKTCKGSAQLAKSGTGSGAYSIKGGSSGWLTVPAGTFDPAGVTSAEQIKTTMTVKRTGTSTVTRTMTLEKRIPSRRITARIDGPSAGVRNLQASIWSVSGLRSSRNRTIDTVPGGTVDFGVSKLGRNNVASTSYRLSLSAVVDGVEREWFWRGNTSGTGFADGGGGWIRDASVVKVNKMNDFVATFGYGTVKGQLTGDHAAGATVRVLVPPPSYPSATSDRRGLDAPYCANDFGSDTVSGGSYSIPFVPRADGDRARYMVDFEPTGSSRGAVITAGGRLVDSCLAALNYSRDFSRLLTFDGGADEMVVPTVSTEDGEYRLTVDSTAVKGGATADRWTSLREYAPGRKILDSPVVAAGTADSAVRRSFDVRPGKYWVEVGRRTGCSAWYPSIYANNYLYHKGGERVNERWKTVSGAKHEYWTSVINGFPASGRKPPKGYKGWMYRDVCKAVGAGKYSLVTVSGARTVKLTNPRGGTISGKVTRAGGKTNKEMLVTAYSTDGTKVLRSAYTSKSGGFVIRGLSSGSYKIVVNADSWRGISRTFSGKHTVKAKAGKNVSAGTLRFKG